MNQLFPLFLKDFQKKKERVERYGRFLKMIDNLQTPKHKTNQNIEVALPCYLLTLYFFSMLAERTNI